MQALDSGASPGPAEALQFHTPALRKGMDGEAVDVPRAGGTLAPAVDSGSDCQIGFHSLPLSLALLILRLLPADQRARAALVARAWRDAAAQPSLWTELDLSLASGVTTRINDDSLRALAARAPGQLTVLNLNGCEGVTHQAVVAVVRHNADSLREVHHVGAANAPRPPAATSIQALARAALHLLVFETDAVTLSFAHATRLLRKRPPFGALRLRLLRITMPPFDEYDAVGEDDAMGEEVASFAAALAADTWLESLHLLHVRALGAPLAAPLWAAMEARRLTHLELTRCGLSPAVIQPLARMLQWLSSLHIVYAGDTDLLNETSGLQLAAAIAASDTLTDLSLSGIRFLRNPVVGAALSRALTAHPSLRCLALSMHTELDHGEVRAVGAMLGELVAANAPALHVLRVADYGLDAGLGPLLDALPSNRHLRELDCRNSFIDEGFARSRLLPAVQANTSLRVLEVGGREERYERDGLLALLLEAEALVAARSGGY